MKYFNKGIKMKQYKIISGSPNSVEKSLNELNAVVKIINVQYSTLLANNNRPLHSVLVTYE